MSDVVDFAFPAEYGGDDADVEDDVDALDRLEDLEEDTVRESFYSFQDSVDCLAEVAA